MFQNVPCLRRQIHCTYSSKYSLTSFPPPIIYHSNLLWLVRPLVHPILSLFHHFWSYSALFSSPCCVQNFCTSLPASGQSSAPPSACQTDDGNYVKWYSSLCPLVSRPPPSGSPRTVSLITLTVCSPRTRLLAGAGQRTRLQRGRGEWEKNGRWQGKGRASIPVMGCGRNGIGC